MNTPTYLDEHSRRSRGRLAGRTPRVTGLRVDTDGGLGEVLVPTADPWSAILVHLDPSPETAVGAETLDTDLAMWFDEHGAEHAHHNPTASVVAAMFGRPGPVFGPVVFTGCTWPQPGCPVGEIRDVSVAATLLLAGIGPTCDPTAAPDRAAEFARLHISIIPAPGRAPSEAGSSHRRTTRQPRAAHRKTTWEAPLRPGVADRPAGSNERSAERGWVNRDCPSGDCRRTPPTRRLRLLFCPAAAG